ncbi:hypothetical protein OEA41_005422 [Lepraria neglecta]|uniref:AB hydrolase-1 domain-containing protein n=1 Tax=Lepraria neglecta TaxID=209136 RepID=A0AAD9YZD6_9LECA|nr:hypothetical protein OEA41_005422 [Lepraria neglecta]
MDGSKTTHPRPTIVFVPGAFHTSVHFEPISAVLNQASFPTTTVELPTTAQATTASYRDDVYAIRSVLERLVEEDGKEVLLALHSYGGVPGCQTVSGLERSKRKAEGRPGGVIHVLFIAALLVEQGQGMAAALEGGKAPSWAVFKDGLLYPVDTSPVFYSDLPPKEAAHWNSLLVPKSASKTSVDVAEVCYDLDVPITYLLCTNDPMLGMLEGMVAKVKRPRWNVERIDGGHSPFLGRKKELAEIVEKCSGLTEANET